MAFSTSSSAGAAVINVTPLIDVLLVLLIVFMVIGPSLSHGVPSSIPKTGNGAAHSLQAVTVQILAGPGANAVSYRIDGEDSSFAALGPRLRQMFATRAVADRTLFVEADRVLSYREVVEVAGLGRAAGANRIALGPEK